jgi:hypothetical protein
MLLYYACQVRVPISIGQAAKRLYAICAQPFTLREIDEEMLFEIIFILDICRIAHVPSSKVSSASRTSLTPCP